MFYQSTLNSTVTYKCEDLILAFGYTVWEVAAVTALKALGHHGGRSSQPRLVLNLAPKPRPGVKVTPGCRAQALQSEVTGRKIVVVLTFRFKSDVQFSA